MLGDAAHDGAVFQPVGYLEFQEFLHLGHCFAFQHRAYADVQLVEVLDADGRLHRVCLVGGSFVCLLGGKQLVHLCLDDVVFYLFEEQFRLVQGVSGFQQVGASQLFPAEGFHVQHLAELFGAERQERFEGDRKVCYQLQGDVEDGCHTVHIRFCQLPRFGVGKVFVADAGKVHCLLLCIAELEYVKQFLYLCLHVGKFLQGCSVVIVQFAAGGYLAFEVFVGQHEGTVHEVSVYGYQFIIITCLKVFPCKVIVLCFRSVGGEYVAQYVLFAGEVL